MDQQNFPKKEKFEMSITFSPPLKPKEPFSFGLTWECKKMHRIESPSKAHFYWSTSVWPPIKFLTMKIRTEGLKYIPKFNIPLPPKKTRKKMRSDQVMYFRSKDPYLSLSEATYQIDRNKYEKYLQVFGAYPGYLYKIIW